MKSQTDQKKALIAKAQNYFDEGYACSQSVLLAYSDQFGVDERTSKLIASSFGAGMGRLRLTCGAVTGGMMVLGLAYGNVEPNDMPTKLLAYEKVQDLYHQVEAIHGTVGCKELLEKYVTPSQVEERQHNSLICRQLVGQVAGMLHEVLDQNSNS